MEARARRMAFRSGALSEVRRAEADRHLKVICSWRRQGSVRRSRWPILIVKVHIEMWIPSIWASSWKIALLDAPFNVRAPL